jgi:hypothetical protein
MRHPVRPPGASAPAAREHGAALRCAWQIGCLTEQLEPHDVPVGDVKVPVDAADDLEGSQLIRRARSDSGRRAYALRLTGEGAALMGQAHTLMDSCEEEFTGVLTPAERSQLADLLARLLNAAT